MKYSLKSSFSRLILALFAMVLLLTIVGRIVTVTGAWAYCVGWPVCVPTEPLGYLKLRRGILFQVGAVELQFGVRDEVGVTSGRLSRHLAPPTSSSKAHDLHGWIPMDKYPTAATLLALPFPVAAGRVAEPKSRNSRS